jgi:hypothetical protein
MEQVRPDYPQNVSAIPKGPSAILGHLRTTNYRGISKVSLMAMEQKKNEELWEEPYFGPTVMVDDHSGRQLDKVTFLVGSVS